MLDLDITLLVVFALLWILMFLLNRFFFRPVGSIISEREAKIAELESRLATLSAAVSDKTQFLEEALKNARRESARTKEDLVRQGETVRETVIQQARQNSTALLERKMAEMDLQIAAAESRLQQEVAAFSEKLREVLL